MCQALKPLESARNSSQPAQFVDAIQEKMPTCLANSTVLLDMTVRFSSARWVIARCRRAVLLIDVGYVSRRAGAANA